MKIVRPSHNERNRLVEVQELNITQVGGANYFAIYPLYITSGFFKSDQSIQLDVNQELIQIFKAEENNIGALSFMADIDPVITVIDDFESYATDADLQAAWVKSGGGNTTVTLGPGYNSSQSMTINISKNNSKNDLITHTFATPQDWSQYTSIKMAINTRRKFLRFYIKDASGRVGFVNLPKTGGVWQEQIFYFNAFNFPGNPVDFTQITSMYFKVTNDNVNASELVDNIQLVIAEPVMFNVQILDFGSTLPATISPPFTSVNFDFGSNVYTLTIDTFNAVVSTLDYTSSASVGLLDLANQLTKGNYYGIRFFGKSGATTLKFYSGASQNADQPLFFSSDGTTFNQLTDQSLFFYIRSNLEIGHIIDNLKLITDPANTSRATLAIYDVSGRMRNVVFDNIVPLNGEIKIDFGDILIPHLGFMAITIQDDGQGLPWHLEYVSSVLLR